MTDEVPLWYIKDRLVDLISSGHGTLDIASDLEMDDWPIQIADIVTEQTVTREGTVVRVSAQDKTEVTGYELRRRNATGGDYADLEQFIGIDATLTLTEDASGNPTISEENFGSLEFFCEVILKNGRSHGGERPPF